MKFLHRNSLTKAIHEVGVKLSYPFIVTDFTIMTKQLSPVAAIPGKKEANAEKTVFFCTECDKEIPQDELLSKCFECGNIFPVDDLVVERQEGNFVFCPRHAGKMETRPLVQSLNYISTK